MSKLIWNLSSLMTAFIFIYTIELLRDTNTEKNIWFKLILLGLPLIILFLHSIATLGLKRSVSFIVLAMIVGWIAETYGLKYGSVFGHYVYNNKPFTIGIVPLSVVCYWAVFIYTGYSIVNSALFWSRKQKPELKNKNFLLLPLLIVLDGLIVTAIDIFMDPIQVRLGSWTWLEKGSYYGIPLANFVGWFVVTCIVTGTFRIFEYWYPQLKKELDDSMYLIPILSYAVIAISFLATALKYELIGVAAIGATIMFSVVIVVLLKFKTYSFSATNRSRL